MFRFNFAVCSLVLIWLSRAVRRWQREFFSVSLRWFHNMQCYVARIGNASWQHQASNYVINALRLE